MQASRSPDGDKVFFTWTESDTTGMPGVDNSNPDLIGIGYDVENHTLTSPINFTKDDANWSAKAIMPKISPVSFYDQVSTYTVPTVIMDAGPSLLDPVDFWYFSDVIFEDSSFNNPVGFFSNCNQNPISGTISEVNPDCGMANGSLVVTASGGSPGSNGYKYEWSPMGIGNTNTANNLDAGIYKVNVVDFSWLF